MSKNLQLEQGDKELLLDFKALENIKNNIKTGDIIGRIRNLKVIRPNLTHAYDVQKIIINILKNQGKKIQHSDTSTVKILFRCAFVIRALNPIMYRSPKKIAKLIDYVTDLELAVRQVHYNIKNLGL